MSKNTFYISDKVNTIIYKLFPEDHQFTVMEKLDEYCHYLDSYGVKENKDRLCFAILKLSVIRNKGKINKFHEALELAKVDYRDLLVAAGFGNDINIHDKWADKF